MSLQLVRLGICSLAIIGVGMTFGARPDGPNPWKAILAEPEFAKLVTDEAKTIKDALAKSDEKKMVTKAKVSALMIAAYAQSNMLGNSAKATQLAGLRDHAIKLSTNIGDNKFDEAKSMVAVISPTSAGVSGAKTEPAELHKLLDLDELMTQFKPEQSGGKALEKKIKAYMQKRAALTNDEIKDAVSIAYQTAIIAQFTDAMAPEDSGDKKKADWVKWSKEMGELGVNAAKLASAAKPDDKAVKAAFKKLDDNCAKCHAVFRQQ
jgi:cytochrome c'